MNKWMNEQMNEWMNEQMNLPDGSIPSCNEHNAPFRNEFAPMETVLNFEMTEINDLE